PDHPDVAQTLYNLSSSLIGAGDAEHAVPLLERSLAILEKSMGSTRPELGYPLEALVRARARLRQLEVARTELHRALSLVDNPGVDSSLLAAVLYAGGELAIAQGRAPDAVGLLDRAMAAAAPVDRPMIELTLADALWIGKGDRARGVALAENAKTVSSAS